MHSREDREADNDGAGSGPTFKIRILPDARLTRTVRQDVLTFAAKFNIGHDDLEEFIFALGEALANAIEHSRSSRAIEVRCDIERDKIVATIRDSGLGFPVQDSMPNVSLPDESSDRGRGLPIMRKCTDIFALHSVPGRGTAVVLGRYLRRKRRGRNEENVAV